MTRRVLLDTNTLYPRYLRDVLLQAYDRRLFLTFWSVTILDELKRNLKQHPYPPAPQRLALIEALQLKFPNATITGYEALIPQMPNDPKDRHVAAAACHAGIPTIITFNLKDFRELPEGIRAVSPDAFLCELLDSHPERLPRAVREKLADYRKPPMSLADLLRKLEPTAPAFAARLGQGLTEG